MSTDTYLERNGKKCYISPMNIYAALALLPLGIAFVWIRIKCNIPLVVLLLCVLLSLVIVVPVSAAESLVLRYLREGASDINMSALALCYGGVVGVIEEVSKALALFALPVKRYALTNKAGVLCALEAGLSLGCFESVAYSLDAFSRASAMGSTPVYSSIFCRIFTSDALHTFCAILGGIFVLSIKRAKGRRSGIMAIMWAIILHSLYDFFAIAPRYKWLSVAAILLAAVECKIHYQKLVEA